ncbi:MAG: hypothetical protein LAO05_06175 [Acidobacteriia bacterium]|nr:hypothetical protein [Terriglobia bacterium]
MSATATTVEALAGPLLAAVLLREGKEEANGEIRFRCPCAEKHTNGDADPSARYNPEKRVWRCDVCTTAGGAIDLARRVGVPIPGDDHNTQHPPGVRATWYGKTLTATWTYRDARGHELGVVARYDGENGKKEIIPHFQREGDVWKRGAAPVPRPLFGQDILAAQPDAPVWAVEGCKCATAIHRLAGVAVTSPNGANAADKADWSPVRDRDVIVWADNDKAGARYGADVARLVRAAGAASVRVIDVTALGLPEAGDVIDYLAAHPRTTLCELEALVESHPAQPGKASKTISASTEKTTQTDLLLDLVGDMELWTTPNAVAFATITEPDGHREHYPVRSRDFRLTLGQRYFTRTGRAPSSHPLADALATIEALARDSGERHEIAVRLAEHDGALYLDIADAQWRAVEITATGWRVVENPPVRFRRSPGMVALPVPVEGGTLDALRPFVPGNEATFRLVLGWLVQAVRACGPYMILVLLGEQGTGKSVLARILRWLIDPNTVALRAVPREERDLVITATNGFVVAIDNVSGMAPWVSDALCRISSGGGFATRELFSDDREALFAATRPIILNGIAEVASRGDLIDRSLLVTLPTIDDDNRRNEREILADFQAAAPAIIGALCSAVSVALARRDEVRLERLPRMADATSWIVAAESALPWPGGGFLETYLGNRAEAVEVALDADSIGGALRQFMENRLSWTGTAGDLLAELGKIVADPKSKDWPGNNRGLSVHLTRLAPAFRGIGLEVQRLVKNHARLIVIEKVAEGTQRERKTGDGNAKGTQTVTPEKPIAASLGNAGNAKHANNPILAPCVNSQEKERKERETATEVEV